MNSPGYTVAQLSDCFPGNLTAGSLSYPYCTQAPFSEGLRANEKGMPDSKRLALCVKPAQLCEEWNIQSLL